MSTLYFDNSATTCPLAEVLDTMREVGLSLYGNPSSLHRLGLEAEKQMNGARNTLAGMLRADPGEIIFTSGGTESNNLAIQGYTRAHPHHGKTNRVIFSGIEHPSVLAQAEGLTREGYTVMTAPVGKDGVVDLDRLADMLDPAACLVSLMHVNNETGAVQPIREAAGICRRQAPGCVLHVDAVQSFGKMPLNPAKEGIDLMTGSGHKIHGPKGIGFLYVRKGVRLAPLAYGGRQEQSLRPGTENVPGIAGLAIATARAQENMNASLLHVQALHHLLTEALSGSGLKWIRISPPEACPYILSLSLPGIRGEVVLHYLESLGIMISTGSACSTAGRKAGKRSHVLTAMGAPPAAADGAVRISFSRFNTAEETERLAEALIRLGKKGMP